MNIKLIPSEGPKSAKIALIGEAPTNEEIKYGRPFIGMTGQLNDQLMASAGIARSQIYITNVWKVQVGKKPNSFQAGYHSFPYNLINTELYIEFLKILKEELSETQANIFIACGELSLFALTGEKGITKRRGSIYPCSLIEGRKVLAMRHPAAALPYRNYCLQYIMIHDYKIAKEESGFPEIRYPQRELKINPSFAEVETFLNIFDTCAEIAFDIEVINEEVSHISFSPKSDYAISIPFNQGLYTLEQESTIWNLIAKILQDPNVKKIGQNLSFDSTFLYRRYGIRTVNMEDTMIGMGIVYSGFPSTMKYKGLDFITSIYTREPYYKDEGKRYQKISFDDDAFQKYNAKDSAVCIEAMPKIKKDLIQLGNTETFEITCRLIEPLVYMAEHGIKVDVEGLKKASEDAGNKINELREELNSLVGYDINPSSPKQLKQYFYVEKGIKPYVSRSGSNKGSITTDVNALKRLSRKGIKEAKLLLEIRHYAKRKGTYFDTKISDDGRLRCSYNPVGTRQGRLSSSKNIFGEGTNNQNLPVEMKRLLLTDPGYVMYNIDLEQAENRIVAYIAPEMRMIEAFENNIDIHKRTASYIWEKPEAEVTDDEGTCPICYDPKTCGHKGERFWGKKANHGYNYGLGYRNFSLLYEIPEKEALQIRNRYVENYPGIKNYWEWIEQRVRQTTMLTNPFGRTFRFMDRLGDKLFKQAYSFIPQSTVPDIINRRGLLFCWDNFIDIELLAQVHDSIVFQIPINIGWNKHAEILNQIKASLEQPIKWKSLSFSIPIECEMGLNMADMVKIKSIDKETLEQAFKEVKHDNL